LLHDKEADMKMADKYYKDMMALEKGIKVNKPRVTWETFEANHPIFVLALRGIGAALAGLLMMAGLMLGYVL
jgi:hypothetical protein